MNQKKYLLISTGVHGLVLLTLLILPASSFTPKKPQSRVKINLQSAASIEAILRQQKFQTKLAPPAPEPVLIEPEPVKVEPPKPAPKPRPVPKPKKSSKKPIPAPQKPKIEPKKPPQTKPKKPETKNKPDFHKFKKIERIPTPAQTADEAQSRQRERAAKAAQDRQEEIRKKLDALSEQNSSAPSGIVELEVDNTLEDLRQSVGESYNRAWQWVKQTEVLNSRSAVEAKVVIVINLDGSVASAQIVHHSGIDDLDRSVQDALNRVRKIDEKPPSKTSIEDRTFTIAFNLKDGRINTE